METTFGLAQQKGKKDSTHPKQIQFLIIYHTVSGKQNNIYIIYIYYVIYIIYIYYVIYIIYIYYVIYIIYIYYVIYIIYTYIMLYIIYIYYVIYIIYIYTYTIIMIYRCVVLSGLRFSFCSHVFISSAPQLRCVA